MLHLLTIPLAGPWQDLVLSVLAPVARSDCDHVGTSGSGRVLQLY